ncbi:hypothetical protein K9M18_00205 [Candidatus Woesearchaeota archaeon]|nr:hypothetical protein [Candidatus Woesearchaeota archaeon]MCF8012948.1 hypothetical protein [Candidatus Woesearchaeota archaeon]
MKTHKLKIKNVTFAIIQILLLILLSFSVFAIPVPKGIDGTIYRLDGLTQVIKGIPITITNLETGEIKNIVTGKGTFGRYSTTLEWVEGTKIQIKASNPINEIKRNTTITGIIHKFDLILNMSIPNLPPEIITENLGQINEEYLFEKQIEIFDWNDDKIIFSLQTKPEGMKITSQGKISWTPTKYQSGIHEITIVANDGELITTKTFQLIVMNTINETNNINQTEINPTKINNFGNRAGNTNLALETQSLTFLGSLPKSNLTTNKTNISKENKHLQIIKNPKITNQKTVYEYIQTNQHKGKTEIKILKNWLKEKGITVKDIIIEELNGNKWKEQKINPIYDDGKNIVFETNLKQNKLYAITIKEGVEILENKEQITNINPTRKIHGKIIIQGVDISKNPKITINTTNQIVDALVEKTDKKTIFYQATLKGNPEHATIKINYANKEIVQQINLYQEITTHDMTIKNNAFNLITGFVSGQGEVETNQIIHILALFAFTMLLGTAIYFNKKINKKNKEIKDDEKNKFNEQSKKN